jgi:hypothetical protein
MICSKCQQERSCDEFYDRSKTNSNAGRKRSVCKWCYLKRSRASNAERRREHRDKLTAIKLEQGCVDCGFKEYASALHFDHRNPEEKRFVIAHCLLYSWETILEEVTKCDIRCATCHAKRHKDDFRVSSVAGVSGNILRF